MQYNVNKANCLLSVAYKYRLLQSTGTVCLELALPNVITRNANLLTFRKFQEIQKTPTKPLYVGVSAELPTTHIIRPL